MANGNKNQVEQCRTTTEALIQSMNGPGWGFCTIIVMIQGQKHHTMGRNVENNEYKTKSK